MDNNIRIRSTRRFRETSPDRAKMLLCKQQPPSRAKLPMISKVQVIYYLSRNGHLEHPHFMEVSHFSNHPLRLKDVIDRLTVLRGKGMPSLYSWSCKRSYKTGYIWNDLSEVDIIYPAEGGEYVLKGSELVEGCSERFQQIQISERQQQFQEPSISTLHPKRKTANPSPHCREPESPQEYEEYDEEDYAYEDGEKTSYTSSTTPHSRCSRGVSTEDLEDNENIPTDIQTHKNPSNVPTRVDSSLSSTTMSSKRFTDSDRVDAEFPQPRNSVLLQLIACGSSAVAKAKNTPSLMQQPVRSSVSKNSTTGSLHKGVVCKTAAKVAEEDIMINYMSENPRFGNLQSEEKEYFSGSIVESMRDERFVSEPVLKKSNSYNEERSTKGGGLEEAIMEEEKREEVGVKGKCIPCKRSSSKQAKK